MRKSLRPHRSLVVVLGSLLLLAAVGRAGDEEAKPDPEAEALREARLKWLQEQVVFIEKLGGIGYDDIAAKVKQSTEKGEGSPDGQALNDAEKKSLNRAEAKAKLEAALKLSDLVKKIKSADDAVQAMKQVVSALPDKTPHRLEAEADLAEMYFKLGNTLTDEYLKVDKEGAGDQQKGIDKALAELAKQTKPLEAESEKEKKAYNELMTKYGKAKDAEEKKKIKEDLDAAKKKVKEIEDKLAPLEEERAQLEGSKASIVGVEAIEGKAREYFTAGIDLGAAVYKVYDEDFWEKLGGHDEAEGKREQDAAMKRLQASFGRKINFSHKMEDAYATQLILYPAGKGKQDLVKKASDYIDTVRADYDQYLPSDKWVYIQWIRVLSHQTDDIDKPKVEDEGELEGEELEEAKQDPLHYLWPTVRMQFIWNNHFTKRQKPGYGAEPEMKVRAMYYYVIALLRSARGHYALADAEPDGERKQKLAAHAQALLDECEKWADELAKPMSSLGEVNQVVRLSARLKTRADLFLFKAERAMKLGKKDAAKEELQKALEETTKVMMEGGNPWRGVVQERINYITRKGERLVGEGELELKGKGQKIVQLLAEADTSYTKATKEEIESRKRQLFGEAMDSYLEVIRVAKEFKDREQRASWLPRTLFRAGICAWQAQEYLEGYLVNFALAREFGSKHYPEAKFPGVQDYATRALGNLHACAGRFLDADEKSETRRGLYADQLFLRMERDPNPDPRLVVKLIDTLKKLKMYSQALALIKDVPPSHLYYRMALLLAADIHQTIMKGAQNAIEKIEKRAEKKSRELTDEEKALVAAEQPTITAHSLEAEKFARLFREAVEKRPAPESDEQKKVFQQEDDAIPGALMIPISNEFARGEYDKAIKDAEDYVTRIKALPRLNEEARLRYVALARWLQLLSHYRIVDHKKAPVDEVKAAIEKSQGLLTVLEEIEKQIDAVMEKAAKEQRAAAPAEGQEGGGEETQIQREEYASKAYMLLASGWNNIANRVFNDRKDANNALKPEDQTVYDDYSKHAADMFRNAEGIAYVRRNIGTHIAKTYFELGMYQEAAEMYDKVIKFWSESLYTPDHIYQSGKSLADVKAFTIAPAIKSQLDGVLPLGEIAAAADDARLVEVLNKAIQTLDYAKNKAKIDAALAAAKEVYIDDKGMQGNVVQAEGIAKRSDLARELELRQKLNRVVVEVAYPLLARSQPMSLLPTQSEYEETIKPIWTEYPAGGDGPAKKNILKYVHDQDLVKLAADKKFVDDYQKDLDQKILAAQKEDPKLAGQYALYKWLFEESLKTYIYGVEENNRIIKRSYFKARQQIAGIIQWNDNEMKLDRPLFMPTNKPKESFLQDLDQALEFNGTTLSAKRRYALALWKLKKNDDALRYLQELVEVWPGEVDLRLDLAETYAAVGENVAEKEFTQKAADNFSYAQIEAQKISDMAKRGTRLWWQAEKVRRFALTQEVLTRKRCGATKVTGFSTKVKIYHRGKLVEVPKKTPEDLEQEAKAAVNSIVMLLRQRPPEEFRDELESMLADLKDAGYEPPKISKPAPAPEEEPTEANPDEAKDPKANEAAPKDAPEGDKAEDGAPAEKDGDKAKEAAPEKPAEPAKKD